MKRGLVFVIILATFILTIGYSRYVFALTFTPSQQAVLTANINSCIQNNKGNPNATLVCKKTVAGAMYKIAASNPPATVAPGSPFAGISVVTDLNKAIIKAGPMLAAKAAPIGGQLFMYLAVIALFAWTVKNFIFGNATMGDFMMFFLKILVVLTMLKLYNLIFVNIIVGLFIHAGYTISGHATPVASFNNIVTQMLTITNEYWNGHIGGSLWNTLIHAASVLPATLLTSAVVIMLLIEYLVLVGTIVLVNVYIVLALILGYLFVPMLLWDKTEQFFNGWLKFLLTSAFSMTMIMVVTSLFSSIFSIILSNYSSAASSGAFINMATGVMVLGIMAYIMHKIPTLAAEIMSGTPNISAGAAIAMAVGVGSSVMAITRLSSSAAQTGGGTGIGRQGDKNQKDANKSRGNR